MTWFILTILAVFAVASAELFQQKILNRINPLTPRTSAVLGYFIQSLMIFPFAFVIYKNSFFLIFTSGILPRFLLVAFLGSVATVFYLKSLQVKNISLSGIFGSLSVVVSTCLGIYFFGESATTLKFIGIGLVLLAIISLNYKNVVLEKNHQFADIRHNIIRVLYFEAQRIAGQEDCYCHNCLCRNIYFGSISVSCLSLFCAGHQKYRQCG